jgi:DDE superfamily endonuclease
MDPYTTVFHGILTTANVHDFASLLLGLREFRLSGVRLETIILTTNILARAIFLRAPFFFGWIMLRLPIHFVLIFCSQYNYYHLTMPRKKYSIMQKLSMVRTLEEHTHNDADGASLRAVARELGVDASVLHRWKMQRPKLEAFLSRVNVHVNTRAASLHCGRTSCLNEIEDDLLAYIWEHREQGMPVSIRMVVNKAGQLLPAFRLKTDRAKDMSIRRFVAANGIVHRVQTHVSQETGDAVITKATDWMAQIRPILVGRDHRFIINMDQTPIFFSMQRRTTLEALGTRSVNVRTSGGQTMRVTVAATVTASGAVLPPLFVFKGKPGGRIEREFLGYIDGGIYTVQQKAWMDESIMLKWVDTVLKPYVATAPVGVEPILFLDSYRCHMMQSVVTIIQGLGVEVKHIPGGCTGLCQPIDVGIGRPLKSRVRHMWEDWMASQDLGARTNAPSRATVASWVVTALQDLPEIMVKKSWRHRPFEYFGGDDDEENYEVLQQEANNEEFYLEEENTLPSTTTIDENNVAI